MNYTYLFISLIIVYTLARITLNVRQSRHIAQHRHQVPVAFTQHINLEEHQKAADYSQAKLKLGLISLAIEITTLILWTLCGGLTLLNSALTLILYYFDVNLNSVLGGVVLFASFGLIGTIIDIPLSWFSQFKLEARYGFNRSTQALFWTDLIKGLILGAVMGLPLLAGILWMMKSLGATWWLWAGSLLIIFNLLMLWIYPTWIAPLFNQFKPLEDLALKDRIDALAQRCGFGLSRILVMDGSKRSGHGNAYFTGFGKNKQIVFFDTLLTQLNPEQTEAVLAHELGHFHHKHVIQRMVWMFASLFAMLALVGFLMQHPLFFQSLNAPFNINNNINHHGTGNEAMALLLFSMVSGYVLFFLSPLSNHLSRKHEFEADRFAATHASGEALKTALVAMYRDNASTLTPDPLYSLVFDSHPPASIRIAALQIVDAKSDSNP